MSLFNFKSKKSRKDSAIKSSEKIVELESKIEALEVQNYSGSYRRNNWYPVRTEHFDGEKTPGEMGVYLNLLPNHDGLRWRAYEAELKSDIVKIITNRFFEWVIGNGLKLQAEPNETVLKSEGIRIGSDSISKFTKIAEARFDIYSSSKYSCYTNTDNLHKRAIDAFSTSFLGGDCLVVNRYENGNLNTQIIDGQHIKSPSLDAKLMKAIEDRGNTVVHGIELSPKGEHVSYYILTPDKDNILGKFERILARGENTGRLMAYMIYGSKHRIDHHRGIPNISSILEKVEKLDRYTEAAVGSAEERAKIVFSVEHDQFSDGENPMVGKARQAAGMGINAAKETLGYDLGETTAAAIAATTSKQTFNMPIGAKLKSTESQTEIQFGDFTKSVFYFLCAAVGIPPEVALQQYEQNYSSSRAAINAWDYLVKVYRKRFAEKFYQNFYDLWLETEVLKNKIVAKGYISAQRKNNFMAIEAYSKARWTGANMPHIDPLKEVKAIREMLGDDRTPLASREQAAEILGLGDWSKNIEKSKEENKIIPKPDEPDNSQNRQ